MKDYKADINLKSVEQILKFANDNNHEVDMFDGCCLDNYIIYSNSKIKIGKLKPRKYIILLEKYLNEWSSVTEMILTDNDLYVESLINQFELVTC